MKGIMDWNICLRDHVKNINPDTEKIKFIQKMCKVRLRVLQSMKIDEETASVAATDYYEVVKELLVAILLKNGLKSENHECLISFFKHNFPKYEYESEAMHKLKEVRNRVSYDGIFVKKDYIDLNKLEFEHIIELLNKIIEE
ncbi:MAG: hypothetical protein ABIF10_06760 [Candidatus Woesearchaeota archaeon]